MDYSIAIRGNLTKTLIVIVISFVLGGLRLMGDRSPLFQAFAHLYVGGFIAAAFVYHRWQRKSLNALNAIIHQTSDHMRGMIVDEINVLRFHRNLYGGLALVLSLLELTAFLLGIGR